MDSKVSHFRETFADVLSSAVGASACIYTGQPFDTVKVRIQAGEAGNYPGLLKFFSNTVKSEGITTLWRGSIPALTGSLAENSVAFATNGILSRFFSTHPSYQNQWYTPFITGSGTGFLSSFVLCPCDLLKCKAQVSHATGGDVKTITQIAREIVRIGGIKSLYTGFSIQLLRDVPFYTSFFGSYEFLKKYFKNNTDLSDSMITMISGGFAGQIGWTCSIAPDTVKTRIQISEKKLTISDVCRSIYRAHGFKGFFFGIEVALVRAFPANAALFFSYEFARNFLMSTLNDIN